MRTHAKPFIKGKVFVILPPCSVTCFFALKGQPGEACTVVIIVALRFQLIRRSVLVQGHLPCQTSLHFEMAI